MQVQNNSSQLLVRQCSKCGHSWVARKPISVVCPACHSPWWQTPKPEEKKNDKQDLRGASEGPKMAEEKT